MKITRWKPVLYRRNAREEEFLQIPRGFWAPLAQLLQTPHLTGAAVALLQAGLPRCFAVRGDCLGHAQDAAARLLPLVLYREALDLPPLTDRCADPAALRDYVEEQLADFSAGGPAATERQVRVCRALPAGTPGASSLQPALPAGCPLPVLVQQWRDQPLAADAVQALERSTGPVLLLQTTEAPAPDGWPVLTIPAADDAWYGELLFQICRRSPVDYMARGEAHEAARGLLQRFGHTLTEQDFALAADYVRRRQGPDGRTNAAYFLQLTAEMPRGTLPCCADVSGAALFRRAQVSDRLQFAVPCMAVAAWKACARRMPRPYPHGETGEIPAGLPTGRQVRNRMHYAPPAELCLHAPCTLLVAEETPEGEDFYGRRVHDLHSYADLAGAAAALNDHRPGVRCWVLVLDCAPEDLQAEDLCRAPYAFCVDRDSLTLYDGYEGLQAFADAAGALMRRNQQSHPGKFSRY